MVLETNCRISTLFCYKTISFLVTCISGVDTFLLNKHQARVNCVLCVLLDFENARQLKMHIFKVSKVGMCEGVASRC